MQFLAFFYLLLVLCVVQMLSLLRYIVSYFALQIEYKWVTFGKCSRVESLWHESVLFRKERLENKNLIFILCYEMTSIVISATVKEDVEHVLKNRKNTRWYSQRWNQNVCVAVPVTLCWSKGSSISQKCINSFRPVDIKMDSKLERFNATS